MTSAASLWCSVAGVALKTTSVRLPLVFVRFPWELALVDEALLVLFGVMSCAPEWLLMDVVLRVLVDLL